MPTDWFYPSREVRQGDSLCPYLFILVAQNLTVMLNFSKHLALILGFSRNLSYSFNQLMYANDLILINTTSRKSGRNVNLFLDLYHQFSGQKPNLHKSEIYFLSWFNKRVSSSICSILNFSHGKTPFKYQGVSIFHKQLLISHFNFMIINLNVVVANCGPNCLRLARLSSSIVFGWPSLFSTCLFISSLILF